MTDDDEVMGGPLESIEGAIGGVASEFTGAVANVIGSLGAPFINPSGEAPVYNVGISTGTTVPAAPGDAATFPAAGSDSMLPWVVGPPNGETNFYRIDTRLQALDMRIIYVGVPDPLLSGQRRVWELHGKYAGAQGVMCGEQFAGLMHAPFELKLESGAYELGASWQRTDWNAKDMSLCAMVNVGVGPASSFSYRMLEQAWWNSWDTDQDGWLGVYTRTHGWRFIAVRLANASKTAFEIDPVSHDNNFMQWDMDITALYPFFSKKSVQQTWVNPAGTSTDWNLIVDALESAVVALIADLGPLAQGATQALANLIPGRIVGAHTFSIANRGTWGAYPKYIVSPPGIAWLQNGWNADGSPQMLQLPLLTPDDGYIMVDTDPDSRTITCTTDPVDPLYMQILRNSSLVEVLLGPEINSTEPIWKQFKQTFTEAAMVPPQSVANLTAWHSQAGGTITCIMPQQYKMAYG